MKISEHKVQHKSCIFFDNHLLSKNETLIAEAKHVKYIWKFLNALSQYFLYLHNFKSGFKKW